MSEEIEAKFRELIMSNLDEIVVTGRDNRSVYDDYNSFHFRLKGKTYKVEGGTVYSMVYFRGAHVMTDRGHVLWKHLESTWRTQEQAAESRASKDAFAEVFGGKRASPPGTGGFVAVVVILALLAIGYLLFSAPGGLS